MTRGETMPAMADSQASELFRSKEFEELSPALQAKVRANSRPGPFGLKTKVVWANVIYMIVLHVLAICGAVSSLQANWKTWVFYILALLSSSLGITAGAHRLWSHRSYKAGLPYRMAVMLLNSMAMQNSIFEWVRDHRLHHKYSETDADPHNAKRGFFFAHVGWLLMRKHPQILLKGRNICLKDLEQDPLVMFQARHYKTLSLLLCVVVPTLIPWYVLGESLTVCFLFLFACRYAVSLHGTWLVNSAAHLWGKRPYDTHTNPADNTFVCYAAFGEGFHNYHHSFPFDYSTGELGPKLNFTTCIIDICAALGLVYDRKLVSQESITNIRHRKGDLAE